MGNNNNEFYNNNNNKFTYFNSISIIGYNTNGIKRNLNFIKYLCNFDIICISETWLLQYESALLLDKISTEHIFLHKADMIIYPTSGRPFGGRVFIVNKKITIINHAFINQYLSTLSISINNKLITCIACYLPYDNGSYLNFAEFSSCLQVTYELLKFFESKDHFVIVIGDFNADILRKKRFDVVLNNFILNNGLKFLSPSIDANLFSYSKGIYKAKLDHCFTSINNHNNEIIESSYIENVIDLSDHKPIIVNIKWNATHAGINNHITCEDSNIVIKLPPNFDNDEIRKKFNKILKDNMDCYKNLRIEDTSNKQLIIDHMYSQLSSSFQIANDACSRTTTMNIMKKTKNWFTNDLKNIKNQMILIRYDPHKSTSSSEKLKHLKKEFKKIMKRNIFLYEKNEFYIIGNLIKENNGVNFFKKVNAIINKNKNQSITIKEDELLYHYNNIFNNNLVVNLENYNLVINNIADISHDNFHPIEILFSDICRALKGTLKSHVHGNDCISANMILNCNSEFINSTLLFFFKFIFHYGVIPTDFNITHIISIIKDKTKSINDVSNLRPISISNIFAQLFERLLGFKIPELFKTHQNQFGYKNRTSCTHALFAFKEVIVKAIDEKKHIFAIKLDAIKAFDKLWREGLFYKMKEKNIDNNVIILLKIYYDKLEAKLKINNKFSKKFKLKKGVKQGGVISGALFNFFINDLIEECCNSGLGAKYVEIILCILGFCDDICLLSESASDLRLLLKVCEIFANKWAIEFNIDKCKFIIFGSNKYKDSIFYLNKKQITFTDNFNYLGIEFSYNLNMSDYFLNKFQAVKNSFFSLNSFGFRPGGVNPFFQAFIYKTYCISRILYGFEIMNINKKTLRSLNISQNDIIRYMTGLSHNSHISDTLRILKVFNIYELYNYMKLIFVKNLKSNKICNMIFEHQLNLVIDSENKKKSLSFIIEYKNLCDKLNLDYQFVSKNIIQVIQEFKIENRIVDDNIGTEIIRVCLENNNEYIMREQLNLVTYAGPTFRK